MKGSSLFCWLKKSLYGLKQALRSWYEKIGQIFINIGFKHHESNQSIYVLHVHGDTLINALCVDDLFITGNNANLILCLKKQFTHNFEMNNLGLLYFLFGIQYLQLDDGILLLWPKYVMDLLKWFKLEHYKTNTTPF